LLEKIMNPLKSACLLGVCLLGVLGAVEAYGNNYAARQYYSGWRKYPERPYYYRVYYYKPSVSYAGYKHHYVIYDPQRPRFVYYYNPYKKVYWGRCPTNCEGRPEYSMLKEEDRKATLEEIPEKAFPKPAALPPIPESDPKEGISLDLPPDDLPETSSLPKVPAKP